MPGELCGDPVCCGQFGLDSFEPSPFHNGTESGIFIGSFVDIMLRGFSSLMHEINLKFAFVFYLTSLYRVKNRYCYQVSYSMNVVDFPPSIKSAVGWIDDQKCVI